MIMKYESREKKTMSNFQIIINYSTLKEIKVKLVIINNNQPFESSELNVRDRKDV